MSSLLFVYGTQLPGEKANMALRHATSLGPATLAGHVLYDFGEYPAAVAGEGQVHGELFTVSERTLHESDAVEGFYPDDPECSLFVRELCTVQLWEPAEDCQTWVHLWPGSTEGKSTLAHGDWRRHRIGK